MREILFKAKRLDNGEWVEGFYVRLEGYKNKISHRIYMKYVYTNCNGFYPDWYEVDPETVCQYTGLKDKNGKKIWENDIVKSDNGFEKAICVVRYGQYSPLVFINLMEEKYHVEIKQLAHGLFYKSVEGNDIVVFDSPYVEVIGNIFDNPELLEVTE